MEIGGLVDDSYPDDMLSRYQTLKYNVKNGGKYIHPAPIKQCLGGYNPNTYALMMCDVKSIKGMIGLTNLFIIGENNDKNYA